MLPNGKQKKKCCSSYATSVPEKNKKGERKQLCLFWREHLEWGRRKGYDWWRHQIFNLGWQLSFCPSSPLCRGKSVFNKLLPRRLLCVQWDSFHNNLIEFHRPFCWRNERICPNWWIPRISTGIQPIHFANSYKFIWKHYSPVRLFHMSKRRESKPLCKTTEEEERPQQDVKRLQLRSQRGGGEIVSHKSNSGDLFKQLFPVFLTHNSLALVTVAWKQLVSFWSVHSQSHSTISPSFESHFRILSAQWCSRNESLKKDMENLFPQRV